MVASTYTGFNAGSTRAFLTMQDEIDIGPSSRAVFVGIAWGDLGPCATFATDDGDAFALDRDQLTMRIEALARGDRDIREELRARAALDRA